MKAQIESSGVLGGVRDGKVHKAKYNSAHFRDEEKTKIKAYLNKLQDIVPSMPKDKKLSKLEVITNVIDYIRYLRESLGLPPCNNDYDMEMMSQVVNRPCEVDTPASVVPPSDPTTTTLPVPSSPRQQESPAIVNFNTTTTLSVSTAPFRQPLCVISSPRNTSCASQESRNMRR